MGSGQKVRPTGTEIFTGEGNKSGDHVASPVNRNYAQALVNQRFSCSAGLETLQANLEFVQCGSCTLMQQRSMAALFVKRNTIENHIGKFIFQFWNCPCMDF